MKKFLVLLLVLVTASMANALVLQISVDGDPDPIDSEIWLQPSQEIILDIHAPEGVAATGDDNYWAIVVGTDTGTIVGGVIGPAAPSLTSILGQNAVGIIPGVVAPEDGPWGFVGTSPGEASPPGVVIDQLLFHCNNEQAEAVVRLITTPDFAQWVEQDRLIIHQVPEPMTVALLGMGGLFLLRRRK